MVKNYKLAYFKDFKENKNLSKTINYLKEGDFKSAQTKKLSNSNYFRAKINYEDRLLFTFLRYQNETYIVLLESILNHEYEKSKFLRGIRFEEEDIDFKTLEPEESIYMNEKKEFRYIEKFISFSEEQESALTTEPPLLLIGSAGSGKTSVVIEKLRTLEGRVLYASLSTYLVENTKQVCSNSTNIDFLTFDAYLNGVEKQSSSAVDFEQFRKWAEREKLKDTALYFEEFKGVLTGGHVESYLTKEAYLSRGVKQSLFAREERELVYEKFEKYLQFLNSKKLYDSNILAFNLLKKVEKRYDYVVIDEVQDFTNIEIFFLLKSLKNSKNFILSGDANQIIYSNFFSWSNLKTMLFEEREKSTLTILKKNYRSSRKITELSNRLLKIKQLRFGSIDKESNYLIDTASTHEGAVSFYKSNPKLYREFNKQTENSVDFALIVFDEEAKRRAKEHFSTPLIFTILEAKGLEYKSVVLLDFIADNEEKFQEIVSSVDAEALEQDGLNYARPKDKSKHELDRYKIYINALYVAFTRTIDNLYILEQKGHRILELLNVLESKSSQIETTQSTKEQWLEEAQRLRAMGKVEQAEEILSRLKRKEKRKPKVSKKERLKERVLRGEGSEEELVKVYEEARLDIDFETIEHLAEKLDFERAKNYLEYIDTVPKKIMLRRHELYVLKVFLARGRSVEGLKIGKDFSVFIELIGKELEYRNEKFKNQAGLNRVLKERRDTITFFELLLKNGAKAESFRTLGPKGLVKVSPFVDSCRFGLYGLVKLLLLDKNININEVNKRHQGTALYAAVVSHYSGDRGFVNMVKLLLENGANPNIEGRDAAPLVMASSFGHIEVVKLLLEYGANIEAKASDGISTALVNATYIGHLEMVKLLISYGAKSSIENEEEIDIVTIATLAGHKKVAKYLKKHGVNPSHHQANGLESIVFNEDKRTLKPFPLYFKASMVLLYKRVVSFFKR